MITHLLPVPTLTHYPGITLARRTGWMDLPHYRSVLDCPDSGMETLPHKCHVPPTQVPSRYYYPPTR